MLGEAVTVILRAAIRVLAIVAALVVFWMLLTCRVMTPWWEADPKTEDSVRVEWWQRW